MTTGNQIKYLQHNEIDKAKWDACITNAPNGLIYGYSFYLDCMGKHWDALVIGDYETAMPLTWNWKYGFYYLYQPAFTASLGVFGRNVTEEIIKRFLYEIPLKFKLIEISLNHENNFPSAINGYYSRINYVLDLNKPYEDLLKAYRENHKRNIFKANQLGCKVSQKITVDDVIQLNQHYLKHVGNITQLDYSNFIRLYNNLRKSETKNIDEELNAKVYGITNSQNKLIAS